MNLKNYVDALHSEIEERQIKITLIESNKINSMSNKNTLSLNSSPTTGRGQRG